MSFPVHTHGQMRACSALTTVIGQFHVYVDGQLWAVDGDPNSHGLGNLKTSTSWLKINGKGIIAHKPDVAYVADSLGHTPAATKTAEGAAWMTVKD